MFPTFQFSEVEIVAFSLVLIRVTSFFATWPVFGTANIPAPIKVLSALLVSFIIFPVIEWKQIVPSLDSMLLIYLVVKEALIGALLGFLCRFFFFSVSIAGQLISISMGLSSAQILNPALGERSSAVEQFQVFIATLFFLAFNGHHVFLMGLHESFTAIPLSGEGLNLLAFRDGAMVVQDIIVAGVKMAAPILVAVLFMNFAVGIVGRAVPQINVLITSWPINILLGLGILIVSMPLFISQSADLFEVMAENLFKMMRAI